METMAEDSKPVPVPRNRGAQDSQNNNTHEVLENVKSSKPIPLPRKLFQRLSSSSGDKKKNSNLPPPTLEPQQPVLSEEGKRGTINIFKRGRATDPFEEFEKEFLEPHPLRAVSFSSPPELTQELMGCFPSMSSSSLCSDSDSSDYYNQVITSSQPTYEPIAIPAKPARKNLPSNVIPIRTDNHSMSQDTNRNSNDIFDIQDHDTGQLTSASSSPSIPNTGQGGGKISKDFYELNQARLKDDFRDHLYTPCSSRTTSLPSIDNWTSLKYNKNRANCLSEGSSSKSVTVTSMKVLTRHGNTYDDVTLEDGTVVFMDNQLNTRSTIRTIKSSKCQNSIVLEFDPLFELQHPSLSSTASNEDNGNDDSEPRHSADSMKVEDNEPIKVHLENPNYFPLPLKSEPVPNSNSKTRPQLSPVEENYEDVAPPALMSSSRPDDPLDDDLPDDSVIPAISALRRNDGGGSFLRRLSHKIRLIPIREESMGSRKSSVDNLPTVPRCSRCHSEHGDGALCKFTPTLRLNVIFSSYLYRPSGIVSKDFTKRWVVLANGKLSVYNDKKVIIEEVLLDKGTLITKKDETKCGMGNGLQLKLFEIVFGAKNSWLVAANSETDRAAWMQKWAEVFISVLPPHVMSSYDRGGWCFIRETVTSEWFPSWMILRDRTLIHGFAGGEDYFELDLRKARSVVLSTKDPEQKCQFVDNSEVLTVDMISKILFIQTDVVKVTSSWEKVISQAATQNGAHFNEMQLTMDEVPVIVVKCIDFLYAHGTLAEGIYRQSGSNTRITQLLADFQKDSWTVQISHKEFSAHDVAGTLKRFFRTLPDPLFTAGLYSSWIATSRIANEELKMKTYEDLLQALPSINKNVLKKLICHLYAVHELHEKNLMPLNNLAPIWGPTLMNVETPTKGTHTESDLQYRTACDESEVVKDLIRNYYVLFRVDHVSREREKKMQDALENFHLGASKRKCSGDMKIWIYIWEKDETTAINITLTPQGTAHTIVQQLCRLAQLRNYENLSIHEVICGNSLERPLHPSEIVIETVLRWSIWDIDERKNNYLILKKNTLYPALIPYAKDPTAVYGDFKFADSKSKSFKKYAFKFGRAMLKFYKHSKATTELGSWKIEDIVWYMGAESKRNPVPKWAFTFVKRNYPFKRSRDEPYFGNVVSCSSEEDLYRWIAAMVIGEHPAGLYPSVIV